MCSKCNTPKPLEAFSRNNTKPGGRQPWCKPCAHARAAQWSRENPGKRAAHRLWAKYRLRPADVAALLDAQGGLCAVCRIAEPRHVDHDHACCPGEVTCGACVRGLLCNRCNTLVGYYECNTSTFKAIASYVSTGRTSMPVAQR